MMRLESLKRIPEAWRLLRISLRINRMAGMAMLSAAVCLLILGFARLDRTAGADPASYFSDVSIGIFVYICILWLMLVPAAVFTAMSQEFSRGTWIFQETAPQSARSLLLGKLIGASGDIYTATAVALPFLFVCYSLSGMAWGTLLTTLLFLLIFSALLAVAMLYLTTLPFGKQGSPMIAPVAFIGVVLAASFIGETAMREAESGAQLMTVNPFKILGMIFGEKMEIRRIVFYGIPFPMIPFEIAYYIAWLCVLFLISEGRLRRILGVPWSRVPIFGVIAFVNFLVVGLFFNGGARPTPNPFEILVALNFLNFAMIYYVILLHAAPMESIRPWLYRTAKKGWTARDLFSEDSPLVFTVIAAVALCACWAVALCFLTQDDRGAQLSVFLLQFAAFAVIAVRDTLFFQSALLMSRKSLKIAILVYFIAFVALTALINIPNESIGVDLTPFTPLSIGIINASNHLDKNIPVLVAVYCAINGVLALIFAGFNIHLFLRARARLKE